MPDTPPILPYADPQTRSDLIIQDDAQGLRIRMPPPGWWHLPLVLKIMSIGSAGGILTMITAHSLPWFGLGLFTTVTLVSITLLRMRHRIGIEVSNGTLFYKAFVNGSPYMGIQSVGCNQVDSVSRAADNSALILRVQGREMMEISYPADKVVLELVAQKLSAAIANSR